MLAIGATFNREMSSQTLEKSTNQSSVDHFTCERLQKRPCNATLGGANTRWADAIINRKSSCRVARQARSYKLRSGLFFVAGHNGETDQVLITIFGTGYVGLVTRRVLADVGIGRGLRRCRRGQGGTAEARRGADLRAGTGSAGAGEYRGRAAALHHGRGGRRAPWRHAVHRRRHAARRGRLGRPEICAGRRRHDRPRTWRSIKTVVVTIHRAGRHRRQGARSHAAAAGRARPRRP